MCVRLEKRYLLKGIAPQVAIFGKNDPPSTANFRNPLGIFHFWSKVVVHYLDCCTGSAQRGRHNVSAKTPVCEKDEITQLC